MKFAAVAFVALSAVSANSMEGEISPFHISNYKNIVSLMLRNPHYKGATDSQVGETGKVTWAQCDDDAGVFTFDESSTTYNPDPVYKGTTLKLNLAGIVSDDMTVTNIHVHVDWNGSSLYDQDLK